MNMVQGSIMMRYNGRGAAQEAETSKSRTAYIPHIQPIFIAYPAYITPPISLDEP